MIAAIGNTLLLGLGIALNPLAIVITILIANREHARRNGTALTIGWVLGLVLLLALPALIIQTQITLPPHPGEWFDGRFAIFRAALGILLLVAAAVTLVNGPLPGEQPADPRWARLLDTGGPGRRFGLGAFLAIVNVRNLMLLAAAASLIGQARLAPLAELLVLAIFIVVATLGLLVPLLVHLYGGEAGAAWLERCASSLTRHMQSISGVVMALFGAILLTNGVAGVL
jgi:hypothetical protein